MVVWLSTWRPLMEDKSSKKAILKAKLGPLVNDERKHWIVSKLTTMCLLCSPQDILGPSQVSIGAVAMTKHNTKSISCRTPWANYCPLHSPMSNILLCMKCNINYFYNFDLHYFHFKGKITCTAIESFVLVYTMYKQPTMANYYPLQTFPYVG